MKNISLPLSFKSDKYYFLVSIEDERTIKAVYEDIVVRRCDLNNLQCEYISFKSGSEFVSIVNRIEKETIEQGTYPHIHFETHGCEEGIQLSNRLILDWNLMSNQLHRINGACGNNLIVTMACCYGGFFLFSLVEKILAIVSLMENNDTEISHRAPFLIIIGPTEKFNFGELEEGFSDFFDIYLSSKDLKEGIMAFKAKQKSEGAFVSRSCQHTFYKFVQENIIDRDFNSSISFSKYHNNTIQSSKSILEKTQNLNEKGRLKMKKLFWNISFNKLQELRRTYFWIDKFPENESRFVKIDMAEEYPY